MVEEEGSMLSLGIMQGRLTPSKGRGIQFFPFDNWGNEFYSARECGLNEIEFIFDYEDYEKNPLWTDIGAAKLRDLMKDTLIQINTVCFDYFMRRPFYKMPENKEKIVLEENTQIIKTVLDAMDKLGIHLIEIPLVDASSLKSTEEKSRFRTWLKGIMKDAPKDIRFGLETDLPVHEFKDYILSFENERLGANYDSGNSSGLGYNLFEEVTVLKELVFNIHIKDRVFQGITVPLGTGSADFERLFEGLKEINYKHSFILQAARGEDGNETEVVRRQMEFVRHYCYKYGLE